MNEREPDVSADVDLVPAEGLSTADEDAQMGSAEEEADTGIDDQANGGGIETEGGLTAEAAMGYGGRPIHQIIGITAVQNSPVSRRRPLRPASSVPSLEAQRRRAGSRLGRRIR